LQVQIPNPSRTKKRKKDSANDIIIIDAMII
jgi:hypothetical protein